MDKNKNVGDNAEEKNHRKNTDSQQSKKGGSYIAVIVFFAIAILFGILTFILIPSSTAGITIVLCTICLIVGALLSITRFFGRKYGNKNYLIMPIVALISDFLPILFLWLASLFGNFTMFLLFAVLSPLIGILLGAVSLGNGKACGKAGIAIAIAAIALPIIFVLVTVLLLSTGVAVLSFM